MLERKDAASVLKVATPDWKGVTLCLAIPSRSTVRARLVTSFSPSWMRPRLDFERCTEKLVSSGGTARMEALAA
jgi:hypothetical protein